MYYKDIIDISHQVTTINYVPCHGFKFIITGQKKLELGAFGGIYKAQLNALMPAIEYIKECRTNAIMNSLDT